MLEIIILSSLIAVALSIDAFLAGFAFATNHRCNHTIRYTPIFVGVFHFSFPIIAFLFFGIFKNELSDIGKYISSAIFVFLGLICFVRKEEANFKILGLVSVILLAASVSIDSLLVGASLSFSINSIYLPALIFGIITALLSYISIKLGNLLANKTSYNLEYLAGIFFILLGVLTYFEVI